ncbi:type IV secretion system DNA-binding domain-containing protein, partial [Candidatus Woesebacteria bacterium]|nr:type IV secretion system DNA-binding domain-containing protein [Candidatus Woesebacteria bacterium]
MAGIVFVFILLAIFIGVVVFVFLRYRGILRYAKGVERGLKMVPLLIHLPPASDDTEVGTRDVRDVLQEKVSQAEVLYNIVASTAQKGFKSSFYGQRHFAFEIVAAKGSVQFYAAVPVVLVEVVKQAVISAYPTAQLEEVEEHNIFSPIGKISGTIGGEIVLKEDSVYPIATIQQTKRDSMQALINALSTLGPEDGAAVQILMRPALSGWEKTSKSHVEKMKKDKAKKGHGAAAGFRDLIAAPLKPPEVKEKAPDEKQLSNLEQSQVDAIEEKTRHPAYEVLIRVVSSSNTANRSQAVLGNIVSTFSLYDSPGLNGFKYNEAKDIENFVTAFIFRFFPPELNDNILNSVELATLFHFPDQQFTYTSQLDRQQAKQVDGPKILSDRGLLLGYNVFRSVKKEIRLSPEDRRRHVYIVGQTGTGKSTVLENMILQDMVDGNGLAFVDPHGDGAEKVMAMIPKNRTEDVIYFNPGDMDNPLGLNLFEFETDNQKDFLIQEAINMLYKLYDPQHQGIIGPRYEHWFRNAALTLMADPKGATFIEIPKIFTDKQFAKEKLSHVKDPTVLDFWNKEMAQTSDYHKSEVLGWFVSKFGAFVSNEMMRNIIGQVGGSFDLREVMDKKKILIVNLSKGRVGELNSKLLGMIFIMKFQAAAMSRADIPEDQRIDFSLYVDEFQNFSTDSFATILSEARKYRLNLIVANQFIGQLTEEIRDAVFGNVGTIITMRAGATDADFLVKQFTPIFDSQDIIKVPNHHAIVRLMIGGIPSQPFSMSTLPPFGQPNEQLAVALKQLSASKYGRARAGVEKDIFKRLETITPPPARRPGLGASGARAPSLTAGGGQNRAATGQLPAAAKKPGSNSFLDEWLAKKRREAKQQPTTPVSQQSTPPLPATAMPTTPIVQPITTPAPTTRVPSNHTAAVPMAQHMS